MARVMLEGVRKTFGGKRPHVAVHGVDLEVADGEFVVLVGPSGCGKSTTLRMIAGLESISAGRLLIGDRVVNELPPKARDIAMVFQTYALYPHMTVYENMAFALKLRKLPAAEVEARVREAAATLNIEPLLDRTPKQLSGGQRQRVAIGRAIVRKPQVFLFDEPLSNLDAKLRVQMRREIASLQRRLRATVIYVTHDQVEAMTMGDRIVVMNEGRVQQIDAPLALYARPRNVFVAGFIGSPAMNLIPGVIERGDEVRFRAAAGGFAFVVPPRYEAYAAPLAGRPLVLGIRPEDMGLSTEHPPTPAVSTVRMRLEVVEPLGNEILLHARAAPVDLTVRIPPRPVPDPGAELDFLIALDRVHLFDAATGERVEWEGEGRGSG
jgi:multiple sugar transport system ATP-binding protein